MNIEGKVFFITGGFGHLGSHFVKRLVNDGATVICLASTSSDPWRLEDMDLLDKIKIYKKKLVKKDLLNIFNNNNIDYIVHLAGKGVLRSDRDEDQMWRSNVEGTRELLKACEDQGFKGAIFAGSCSEYGDVDTKAKEDLDASSPTNYYSLTKQHACSLVEYYAEKKLNFPCIWARLYSFFGAYESDERLFPMIIKNALNNEKIKLNNPNKVQNFMGVENFVDAMLFLLLNSKENYDCFNISQDSEYSVVDYTKMVLDKVSASYDLIEDSGKGDAGNRKDPAMLKADCSKLERLGWTPNNPLSESLDTTIEYYKKRLI